MNDITSYLNQIICGDNVSILRQFPDESIDLTVTSPPYDNLRSYNKYSFDFREVAIELYRITKPGGVVVWIVGDATINGGETLSSLRQAIHFVDICGFTMHDTMIYKNRYPQPKPGKRYTQAFEYMFVLSKGKIRTFDPITEPCKHAGKIWVSHPKTSESAFDKKEFVTKSVKPVINIWEYNPKTNDKTAHPATFPEKLAHDHITSWSNEHDIVLDPFVGSGTTCKMAKLLNRNYIGIDISDEYCEIARKRIEAI